MKPTPPQIRKSLRQRRLTRDELALWRHVIADVTPRPGRAALQPAVLEEAFEPPSEPPGPAKAAPEPPRRIFLPSYSPAPPTPKKHPPLAPLEKKIKRKLGSGRLDVDDKLDLHGMTQAEAHRALNRFLWRAAENQCRMVLVVTGKGGQTRAEADGVYGAERGVLRRMTPLWLRAESLRPIILSIEEAGRVHGGGGALYVRLRRRGENS